MIPSVKVERVDEIEPQRNILKIVYMGDRVLLEALTEAVEETLLR